MISLKQKKILAFPYSDFEVLICDGAVRSGKTSLMTVAFIDWAMREFNGRLFGICGKTVGSAKKNIIIPYISMVYAKQRYLLRWRGSDNTLEITRGNVRNTFEVFGGKDESSFSLIQGRTLAGILLDEVVLMPESFFNQALARCSVDGARFWFSCNPGSPNHWFYRNWILKSREQNALYLHFEMTDNPGLSEKTLERYQRQYSGVFYDRYVRGLWVRAEGVIYPVFADNAKRFAISCTDLPRKENGDLDGIYITVGVDFGGNKSAHAFVATLLTADYTPIALRSLRMPASGVSVEQMIAKFTRFCEGVEQDYGRIDYVFADCAEQAIINSMYQQTKYNVRDSVKGAILDRIRTMDILLSSDRFRYVQGQCDSLVEALKDAVWDEKQQDDVRLDDGTSDIDTLDAWEYSWSWVIKRMIRG